MNKDSEKSLGDASNENAGQLKVWTDDCNRRRFLKSAGGATAGTLMAWNASTYYAHAGDQPNPGGSGGSGI